MKYQYQKQEKKKNERKKNDGANLKCEIRISWYLKIKIITLFKEFYIMEPNSRQLPEKMHPQGWEDAIRKKRQKDRGKKGQDEKKKIAREECDR